MRGGTGIACLIALVIAASGCGGGGGKADATPSTGLKRSATGGKLKQVTLPGDARQLGAVVQAQTKSSQTVRITASTTAQSDTGRFTIELTGALLKPTGNHVTAALKVVEVGGKSPGTTHVMVGDGTVFTRVEGESYAVGKPWLQITKQDLSNPNLDSAVKEAYQEAVNVAQSAVQQASTDMGVQVLTYGRLVENPRWEKIEGTDVRRYAGVTQVERLAKVTNDPRLLQMSAGGVKEFPWTMWIDKYGLPRRFTSTLSLPNSGEITSRSSYSGWGQPLTITFPAAQQVASIND
jgi:hypothetical protein